MLSPERQQIMTASLAVPEVMAQAPERQSDTDSQVCSPGPRQRPEEQTLVTQSLLVVQCSLLESSRALSTASLTPSPSLSVKGGVSVGSVPLVPARSSSKSLWYHVKRRKKTNFCEQMKWLRKQLKNTKPKQHTWHRPCQYPAQLGQCQESLRECRSLRHLHSR